MDTEKKGRQYQDTVFRMYFNDAPRLKELAGALHGRSYGAAEPLEIVTLEGTFLSQLKNDISFLLASRQLVFIEHQSTKNQNMALRCLYYICEQLRRYIPAKQLYQNKRILLPQPEFHVFYTGSEDAPETEEMKLSEGYMQEEGDIRLELEVIVHNIAYGSEKRLLQKSRSLHDYSFFMNRIQGNIAGGMERGQAIREAMRYCMEHDVMKEFLQTHEREVVDMVDFEWNQKDFEEAIREDGIEQGMARGLARGRDEGRAEGRAEGRDEGRAEGLTSSIRHVMSNLGVPMEKAMDVLQIPLTERAKYAQLVKG